MTWEELAKYDLVIYSTAWCPDCRRLKARLDEQSMIYTEVDIDADTDAAKRLQEQTGRMAIPFVEIDSTGMIRGWHEGCPGKWDSKLFLAEAEELLGR